MFDGDPPEEPERRSGPDRLPRGRHRLSREQVVAAQRARILRAMADAMVERGYAGTPVAEILRRAGVSRETFYQQFGSKEQCFAHAYEAAVEILLDRVGGVRAAPASRAQRIDRVLRAYLDALADEPAFARLFLVEVYAAGPEALAKRAMLQAGFVDLLGDLLGVEGPRQRFACEALVAAISSMVTARVAAGDVDGLRALHAPLLDLIRTGVRAFAEE